MRQNARDYPELDDITAQLVVIGEKLEQELDRDDLTTDRRERLRQRWLGILPALAEPPTA